MQVHFMKSLFAAACLTFASVAPLAAQASDLQVNVPFAFIVDGQHLDAGRYFVQVDEAGLAVIESQAGHSVAVITDSSGNYNRLNRKPGLSFERNAEGEPVLTRIQFSDEPSRLLSHHSEKATGTAAGE